MALTGNSLRVGSKGAAGNTISPQPPLARRSSGLSKKMNSIDLEHKEHSTRLPEPLEISGPLGLGRVLPAVGLSISSAAAFAMVATVLLHDRRWRSLFELPFPATWVALPAAVLALLLLWRTSLRPGRHFPRYWVLFLAVLSSVLAVATELPAPPIPTPLLHVLMVAAAAAVLTLLPRLIKLHPHSAWMQRVSFLSLLVVLLIVLPAARAVGNAVEAQRDEEVGARIRELRERTALVKRITDEFDWTRYDAHPALAEQQLDRLGELRFAHLATDLRAYRAAAIFGRERELAGAARELIDAVAFGLEGQRLPRISTLSEPAVRYDTYTGGWIESASFPRLSAIVGRYQQELGRLFAELAPGDLALASDALQELAAHHRERRTAVRLTLEGERESFPDHWMVARAGVLDAPAPSLADVLKMPMLQAGEAIPGEPERRRLTAGSLVPLLGLPQHRAREFERGSAGCHPRSYDDRGDSYYRLDCYAYAPNPEGPGASLRVEFRLVYRRDLAQPLEAYFIFPIPPGTEEATFRAEALDALASAVREVSSGEILAADRSGSVAGGFRYHDRDSAYDVLPLSSTQFSPDRWAIQVRVVPRSRAERGPLR